MKGIEAVKPAAAKILRRNRGFVDYDDLVQIGMVYLYDHSAKIEKYYDEEPRLRMWLLNRDLSEVMRKYTTEQRALKTGYDVDDLSWYSPAMVESMLPYVLHDDREPPNIGASEGRSTADPAEGGNWLAMIMDVGRAWESAPLTETETAILVRIYCDGRTQADAADDLDLSQQAVSRAVRRALAKLADALGGGKPRGCPYDCECHEGRLRRRPGARGNDSGLNQMLD